MSKDFIDFHIPLTKGNSALVDKSDYEWLSKMKWYFSNAGYPVKTKHMGYFEGKRKTDLIYMHRAIMNPPKGMEVDHINGNKLDNRRSNLRLVTSSQNKRNQRPIRGGYSKYKGVTWQAGKWVAQIKSEKVNNYLGRYNKEIDAAIAYNEAALEMFGVFANLNCVYQAAL